MMMIMGMLLIMMKYQGLVNKLMLWFMKEANDRLFRKEKVASMHQKCVENVSKSVLRKKRTSCRSLQRRSLPTGKDFHLSELITLKSKKKILLFLMMMSLQHTSAETTDQFLTTSSSFQPPTSLSSSSFPPPPTTLFVVTNGYDDSVFYYDEPLTDETWTFQLETAIVSIVYSITFVCGSVGNGLVIVCILKFRRMRSVTNVFLLSLALADLMLVLVCVPVKLIKWFTYCWMLGKTLCKLIHYIQNVSVICSVLTLTSISIERYYAILKPLKSRFSSTMSRARRIVIFLWLLSLFLASPLLYAQTLKEVEHEDSGPYYWCLMLWNDSSHDVAYHAGMLVLIVIFPLSVMTFCYFSISRELWKMLSLRGSLTASSQLKSGNSQKMKESEEKSMLGKNTRTKDNSSLEKKCNLKEKQELKDRREDANETQSRSNKGQIIDEIKIKAVKKVIIFSARPSEASTPPSKASSLPSKTFHATCHDNNDDVTTKKQVVKMLIIVVVLYAICWVPVTMETLLTSLGYLAKMNYGVVKHLRQLIVMMSYVNSCVNPVVYAFMSKNFRVSFCKMILCGRRRGCCGRRHHDETFSGVRGRAGMGSRTSKWKRETATSKLGIAMKKMGTPSNKDLNPLTATITPCHSPLPVGNSSQPFSPQSVSHISNLKTLTSVLPP